jgi:hypothetical protein
MRFVGTVGLHFCRVAILRMGRVAVMVLTSNLQLNLFDEFDFYYQLSDVLRHQQAMYWR